jgi:nucleoside 2-deoxyribosyltransferase
MKIYFAGSIRGGRNDQELYSEIIDILKKYGKVLTEHIGDPALTAMGTKNMTEEQIYDRMMDWIKESDAIVAEVSTPSIGVGYEIALSESMNKKIICLYREGSEKRISAMVSGNKNLIVINYKVVEDLPGIFDEFFLL